MSDLRSLLSEPDVGLLASGAIIFGVQRLAPPTDKIWYGALNKPRWTPPNWGFPAAWIPLKALQSVAAWAVYKHGGDKAWVPLGVFGVSLFLGNMWNVMFFGRKKLKGSLPWMGAFWVSVAATIAAFYPIHPAAAALVAPTLLWVTIAAALNFRIVQLNPTGADSKQE